MSTETHAMSQPLPASAPSAQPTPVEKLDPVFVLFAAVPWLGLAVLYSYAARAWFALGHWPQPYRPDPKDLDFFVHHMLVGGGLTITMTSPLAVLLGLALRRWVLHRRDLPWRSLAVFAVGYGLFWALVIVDPGHVAEWYFD
jgi:hypothetical protein